MIQLQRQVLAERHDHEVEVIIDHHETDNVGVKRNRLLQAARGKMVAFIDSDDMISPNYVYNVLKVLKTEVPDCIAINGIITFNGRRERKWFISKEYGHWYEYNEQYFRTPNHISPVRRELALQAGFPEISFGEDAEFSRRLLPLLKTEALITEPMYYYNYRDDEYK